MEFAVYRDEIYQEYQKFQDALPPRGTPAYHKARQPIIDFCDQLENDRDAPGDTRKSVLARMFAAKNQFTGLVTSLMFIASLPVLILPFFIVCRLHRTGTLMILLSSVLYCTLDRILARAKHQLCLVAIQLSKN